MNRVFVDTSFYVAMCSPRDIHHQKAVEFSKSFCGELITTDYVLLETGNCFSKVSHRDLFVELMDDLQGDPQTTILEGTHDLFSQGVQRYRERLDKDWSLADCISFVVMEALKISVAVTADHHFRQAGFQTLL